MWIKKKAVRHALGAFLLASLAMIPAPAAFAQEIKGHHSDVMGTAVTRNGLHVLSVGSDEAVLWDATKGEEILAHRETSTDAWKLPVMVTAPAFSPDDSRLAFNIGTNILLIDIATKRKGMLKGHENWVRNVVFSPDGKMLLSKDSSTMKVWDLTTGKLLQDFTENKPFQGAPVQGVFLAGENSLLLTYFMGRGQTATRLLDTKSWQEKRPLVALDEMGIYGTLAISPDGKTAFASYTGDILAFDTTTGKKLYKVPVRINSIDYAMESGAQITPDGKTLVVYGALTYEGAFHQIFVWDMVNKSVVARMTPEGENAKKELKGLSVSGDGKTLYAGRGKKVVRFDVATGKEVGAW